ncbi:uncharacterized protein PG986_007834 [Apiospora aurea]|uniref:Rhodopsin domain-containing protein n=1 Tax=Apiospora aurea TaxID=335848 RepID=A0ABR1QDP7_9PEZI
MCISTDHGMGQHVVDISSAELANFLLGPSRDREMLTRGRDDKLHYIGMGTFIVSSICVKLALLFQYLRIFPDRPQMMRLCQGLIAFTLLYGLGISFISWFPCFPPVALWDTSRELGHASCYGFGAPTADGLYHTYVTVTSTNVVLNLVILLVATPLYFRKRGRCPFEIGPDCNVGHGWIASRQAGRLIFVVFFRALSSVNSMAIWRLIHVQLMWAKSEAYPTFDPTWYAPTTVMLAVLEVNGATVCASIPIAGSLFAGAPPPPPPPPPPSPSSSLSSEGIMVTRDIRIERSRRYSLTCEHHLDSDRDRDRKHDSSVSPTSPPPGWQTGGRRGSRAGSKWSDVSITTMTSGSSAAGAEGRCCRVGCMNQHYRDSFIRSQVDPFDTFGRVRAVITAGPSPHE